MHACIIQTNHFRFKLCTKGYWSYVPILRHGETPCDAFPAGESPHRDLVRVFSKIRSAISIPVSTTYTEEQNGSNVFRPISAVYLTTISDAIGR
jgi:hypothetical protein